MLADIFATRCKAYHLARSLMKLVPCQNFSWANNPYLGFVIAANIAASSFT